MAMPSSYRQRQKNIKNPNQEKSRNENSVDPRHYRNYYETVIDIARELGAISFTLYSNDDKELYLKITKDGFYRNNETMSIKPMVSQTIIARHKDSFYQALTECLKNKGILTKYLSVVRLALLSDEAERIGNNLKFVIRDKGMQKPLFIIPGTGTSKTMYTYINRQIGLEETRRLFSYYEADIIIQMKSALEFALLQKDMISGEGDEKESKEAKEKLGIKAVQNSTGKILISANSILNKREKEDLTAHEKKMAAISKELIFGKRR